MVRVQIYPYLRPSRDLVTATEWRQIAEDGSDIPLSEHLPHWDPGISITAGVTVHLDLSQIWQECRLSEDDQLRLALLWDSSGTGLRGKGRAVTLPQDYPLNTVELDVCVPGALIADQVRFTIHLLLAHSGKSMFRLAPRISGSILWQEEKVLVIKGEGPRFPTEFLNFEASSNYLPAEAGWYLEWNSKNFEETFMGSVRLFLNSSHKAVRKSVQGNSREDYLIQSMIRFDVGKTLITVALASSSFIEDYQSYEEGSVGATIRNMLYTYFPGDPIEGLAALYHNSPGRLECILQDRFRLFEEV